MVILILILFVASYVSFIWIIFMQFFINKELRQQLELKNNSIKLWLNEEVSMKRTYSKLSDALILDRDEYRNKYSSLHKKYNRLNRIIKSYIKWRITFDILISKLK